MQPRVSLTAIVSTCQKYLSQAMFIAVSALIAASSVTASAGNLDSSYDMNVLVIKYFHINQNTCYPVDVAGKAVFTPSNCIVDDKIRTLAEGETKPLTNGGIGLYQNGSGPEYYWNFSHLTLAVQDQVDAWKMGAEKASTYLGPHNGTGREPALRYRLIYPKTDAQSIALVPYIPFRDGKEQVNYNEILTQYNICDYVDNKGVREVWILKGNHQDAYLHSESRMGVSKHESFGEEANGDGSVPLIRCSHTYRVYTHTYDRSDLVLHGWGHQIERELDHISGYRDASGNKVGPELFSRFNVPCADNSVAPCYPMSLESSLPAIPKMARCGTVHTTPNSAGDEKNNTTPNPAGTDCMDWQPEGLGQLDYNVSCSTWGCGAPLPPYDRNNYNYNNFIFNNAEHNYSIWHWAYMPGRNNNKKMGNGQQLRNWWDVHGDFDGVKTCNTTLLDSSECIADLGITSFQTDPNPLAAGSTSLVYHVSAINNGPGTVPDGRVKITLPSGSTYVPGSSTSPDCYASGLTVTCYLGKLAQGGTRNFVLNVTPPFASSITATATTVLPGTFEDTVPGNNSATTVTAVVFPPPTITSFSPTFGQRDTIVFVYGTNFVPGTGQTAVSLNGVDAQTMQVVLPEILFFRVPSGANTGKIKVTTPFGSAESLMDFIVSCTLSNPATQVLSLGPGTGPTNEEVKVTFSGYITNAAAITANPATDVIKVCAGTTINYTATTTKGTLNCRRDTMLMPPSGVLQIDRNIKLVCSNISGGGGDDMDVFSLRPQP